MLLLLLLQQQQLLRLLRLFRLLLLLRVLRQHQMLRMQRLWLTPLFMREHPRGLQGGVANAADSPGSNQAIRRRNYGQVRGVSTP